MIEESMSEMFDRVNSELEAKAVTLTTIETQQAQIKGLVEALEHVQATISHWPHDENCGLGQYSDGSCNCGKEQTDDYISESLAILPAEFLEKERKREAVIRAAKQMAEHEGPNERDEVISLIYEVVDALEVSP